MLSEEIQKKWAPVLEHSDLSPIKDNHRRAVTAQLLENTERELRVSGAHGNFNLLSEAAATASLPILIAIAPAAAPTAARAIPAFFAKSPTLSPKLLVVALALSIPLTN